MIKYIKKILIFFILILISLGSYFIYENHNKVKMADVQSKLKPAIKDNINTENTNEIENNANSENELMDFTSLKEVNTNIIAWLKIDGTYIDYPIVQGSDNQYYTNHTSENYESSVGSLFLDYRLNPNFSNFNNIIYGHNLNNGRMFGQIVNFKDSEWFDSHATGWLYTSEKTYKIDFFSVLVTKSTSDIYEYAFVSKGEIENHIDFILKNSIYKREINIVDNDKLIVLSTCSYEYEEARTVLIGIIN